MVDVVLDVDAGFLLELLLPVLVVAHHGAKLLPELGPHHVLDVSVGHQRGVGGHVPELGRTLGAAEGAHRHAGVVGHQPRAEPTNSTVTEPNRK